MADSLATTVAGRTKSPTVVRHTMATDETDPETGEAAVSASCVRRVAEDLGVDPQALANVCIELHGELLGRHSKYERTCDYVTDDGVRAYRVTEGEWDDLFETVDVEADLATATMTAHTEQAGLLFASAVGVDDRFAEGEAGVVVGIDTAEQF